MRIKNCHERTYLVVPSEGTGTVIVLHVANE